MYAWRRAPPKEKSSPNRRFIDRPERLRVSYGANFCIEFCMRSAYLAIGVAALLWCCMVQAATAGSFRGTVVEGDKGLPHEGWLYVRGKNESIRRVDVSQATFDYDESVPVDQRKRLAREQAGIGADVRVTAEQGSDGEWRASRVEIVKPAPAKSVQKLGSS